MLLWGVRRMSCRHLWAKCHCSMKKENRGASRNGTTLLEWRFYTSLVIFCPLASRGQVPKLCDSSDSQSCQGFHFFLFCLSFLVLSLQSWCQWNSGKPQLFAQVETFSTEVDVLSLHVKCAKSKCTCLSLFLYFCRLITAMLLLNITLCCKL